MKKTRKGLMPALLGAVCSVVALTSVSYAWFTLGNNAEVGEIDVNVQSADGMQVSVDGVLTNFGSVLSYDALNGIETNYFKDDKVVLSPVSTDGTFTNGSLAMFSGSESNAGVLKTEAAKNTQFIQFDFYVKLDNDSKLYLDLGSYVKDTVVNKKSSYASRVSFANLGNVALDDNYTAASIQEKAESGKATIWEPNSKDHTIEGKDQASYDGITSAGTGDEITKKPVTTLKPTYDTNGTTAKAELLDLKAGVNKVRVCIWLEGQDSDCTNLIDDGSLQVKIKLTKSDQVDNQ
jgi:hypothetical protein